MKWIAAAIVILAVALLFRLGLLAYAMYGLVAALLASRLLARSWARSLSAERRCNQRVVEIGATVAVVVEVGNTSAVPIGWTLVEDLLPRRALMHKPPDLQLSGKRIRLTMLRGHGEMTLYYQLLCNRRGYYQIGPLVAETGDFFGLHRRFRIVTEPHFVMVLPRIVPLEGYDIASRRPHGEVRMSYRIYEDPTRIAGVRTYLPGDPLNRVHWKATARTGTLHSKVYEPSSIAGATMLLDFHERSYADERRSDLAVTAAASVANALYQMGQQVGLITNGRDAADRIRVEGWAADMRSRKVAQQSVAMRDTSDRLQPTIVETRRGSENQRQIMETLARVESTDGLEFHQLVAETAPRMPRDATLLCFLADVDTGTVVTLEDLKRRGFAVSAVLNVYDEYDFARASGPLLAIGVDTYHLKDERSISSVCRRILLR